MYNVLEVPDKPSCSLQVVLYSVLLSCCVDAAVSACSFKPCAQLANATGVCLVVESSLGYSCACRDGYRWTEDTCTCAGKLVSLLDQQLAIVP